MSSDAQAVFFFIAALGCLLASFWGYWGSPTRASGFFWLHPGWLGLASFCFVFFWIAVKA